MDACTAFFNSNSPADYSEFTGDINNGPNGPTYSVVGGNIYRPNPQVNTHSCTPGVNNSAICVSSQDDCTHTSGSDKAIQFDIQVVPGSNGTGAISCLSFYEAAPQVFNWNSGSSGINNYPTKYGVRVTVNGVEVYKQIDIATSNDWTLENFNFSNVPAFTVTQTTTFHFELLGYCTIGNGGLVNAWDIDELKVVYKEGGDPDGGVLTTSTGDNAVTLCDGDLLNTNLQNASGDNFAYVVTNAGGNILSLPSGSPFSFTANNTTCFLWHLSYEDGLLGLAVGQNAANLQGCYDFSEPIVVTKNTNPEIVNINSSNTTCGNDNGTVSAVVSNGTGSYNYDWSNGGTTSSMSNLSAGVYTLTVTDSAGCSDTQSVTIDGSTNPIATIIKTNTSCGENNGSATVSGSSGTGGYMYTWSNGGSGSMIFNLSAGTYTVTLTDSAGCVDTESVTIGSSTNPVANASKTNTTCGENNGTASVNASAGTGGYSYAWSNGANTPSLNNLSAGVYTVTVSDSAGCTATTTVTVGASVGVTLSMSSDATTCGENNGSASVSVLTGNGGYSYNWNNGSTASNFSGANSGVYTVTVTDSNGCTQIGSVNIGSSVNPNNGGSISCVDGSNIKNICEGAEDQIFMQVLNNIGANSAWIVVDQNGNIISISSNPIDISGLAIGNYEIYHISYDDSCGVMSINTSENVVSSNVVNLDLENPDCAGLASFFIDPVPPTGTFDLPIKEYTISITQAGYYNFTPAASCDYIFNLYPENEFDITNSCSTDNLLAFGGYSETNSGLTQIGGAYLEPGDYQLIVCSILFDCTDNIIGGAITMSCTELETGMVVTDLDICHDLSNAVPLNINPVPVIAIDQVVDTTCGEDNGSATASATGGSGSYIYQWSNGVTTATASDLAAGTYSVTVTDIEGCTDVESVTIEGSTSPIVSTSGVDTSCGASNGSATGSATSGTGSYIYTWSNGSTGKTISNLSAGTYTVTVTDSSGCTDTETVTIGSSTSPVASINKTDTSCGGSNGSATASATSGTGGYTYSWSNGSTGATISNLSAGSYTVTVTDTAGCTDTETVTIGTSTSPVASINKTDTSCGGSNGSATASATSGTGGYTYSWSNGSTGATISNLSAGSYTVTVTDTAGCTDTETVTIGTSTSPVVSINKTDTSCGGSNGSATASATSGTGGYTYSWSNGSMGATISNLLAGSYTLTVTDSSGCTDTETVTIGSSTSPIVSINKTDTSCGGSNGSATASATSGTGGYTYSWSNGSMGSTISNLSAGSYTVTVTDTAGCTDIESTNIQNSEMISATINSTGTTCSDSNGSLTVIASSGSMPYTYLWSNGATTMTVDNLVAGNYTVTVTGAIGCVTTASAEVSSSNSPLLTVNAFDTTCGENNGSANTVIEFGTGNITYLWSTGSNTAFVNGLQAGDYSVTITDVNGCTDSAQFTIAPSTFPVATIVGSDTTCGEDNGSATATASSGSGSYIYAWSTGATTSSISGLEADVYSLTLTDSEGCTDVKLVQIGDSSSPEIALSVSSTTCGENNGAITSIVTMGTAGYTYAWSNGATGASINNLTAGTYTLTVTDAVGCVTVSNPVSVGASTSPVATVSATATTCGASNGSLSVAGSSGTGSYSYLWNTGATSATISNLSAGNYSVTLTDSAGCTDVSTVQLNSSNSPVLTTSVTNTTCGELNGSATASATSGAGGYTYLWSNGSMGATISNLAAGSYTVTVTDTAGCSDMETVTIGGSANPQISLNASNTTCGENNGSIMLNVIVTGVAPLSYNWDNGATTASLNNLPAGTYAVTVTDATGCTVSASTTVLGSSNPVITLATSNTTCGDSNGTATANVTGGSGSYTYSWSNGAVGSTVSNLVSGNYTLTVTDTAGCTSETAFSISSSDSPIINLSSVNTTCGDNNGVATANVSGGTGTYTYSWSNGAATSSITNLSSGTYTVTVTDTAGCQAVSTVSINSSSSPQITENITNEICSNGTGTIGLTVNGGTGAYSYNWSNGATSSIITNLMAGLYTVTVTDGAGCTVNQTFTITNETDLEIEVVGTNTCCGEDNGSATVTMECGIEPYMITWSNGGVTSTIDNLAPGTYSVTVVDAVGDTEIGSVTIGDSTSPNVTINGTNTFCGENNGSASINVSSGLPPYTISWSNGVMDELLISDLAPGSYSVTVTDTKGCTTVETIFINPSILPNAGNLNGGPFLFCIDGSPDFVGGINLTNVVGTNTMFIVTDVDGNILATPDTMTDLENYNFETGQAGFCYIYHLSYEGNIFGLGIGLNVDDINGCFDLVGAIEVEKNGSELDYSTVLFDLNACSAGVDFDEFTADIDNYNGCTEFEVIGDNLNAGFSHSCTPGVNNSLGMCFSAEKSCTYDPTTDKKLVINLRVSPGSFGTGGITGLSFYEQAPDMFLWTDGTTGDNNYPTLFAIRILKNNIVIFEDDDLATSQAWSLSQFDFSTNPDFMVTSTATFTIELIPYCAVGNNLTDISIWDVDEINIFSECNNPLSGGTLEGGPYDICLDELSDNITDLSITSNAGDQSILVVADDQGNILHLANSLDAFAQIDFNEGEEGICYIWHISAENGFSGAVVGNNINSDLDGCYNLSNSIAVVKTNCGQRFQIYPNPAIDGITVKLQTPDYHTYSYEIVDHLGRTAITKRFMENNLREVYVDLSTLAAGRYYLKVVSDSYRTIKPILVVR